MSKAPPEVQPVTIEGGSGNDTFNDQAAGFSTWNGNGGNDLFVAHATDATFNGYIWVYNNDYFNGGSGIDTASYVFADKKIVANLEGGVIQRIFQGSVQSTDYVTSVENVLGTAFGDSMYGSSADNRLQGGGGNDWLFGFDGDDHLLGDSGNDVLYGGQGADKLEGSTGNDSLLGEGGADQLWGGDGADTIDGGDQNDQLWGGAHGDSLRGGAGNDTIDGGTGNDTIDGGDGLDTAAYSGNAAVTVNLLWGTASGAQGNDTILNVENVSTGGGADVVFGSNGANSLTTGGGADVVYALDGNDTVDGGAGNDTLFGYDGADRLVGGTGDDSLSGDGDNDLLFGGAGNDRMSGGDGNDSLQGGGGTDTIRGGAGVDTLTGGIDADVFRWERGDEATDQVTDFVLGQDKVSFATDFFAQPLGGGVALADVLLVFDSGADAWLAANTAEAGWQYIAVLRNVDAYAVGQAIESGSILAANVTGLGSGAPDGLFG